MKKFLYSTFMSLLGLLALGTFFLGSDVNALCAEPRTPECHIPECSTFSVLDVSNIPNDPQTRSQYLCNGYQNDLSAGPTFNNGIGKWTCYSDDSPSGINTLNCSAPVKQNGSCSTTVNTCTAGTAANYNANNHSRSCNGTNGGSNASCSIPGQRCLDTTKAGGCFVADTLVTMSDGSHKAIQDIKVGDKLKAVEGNNTVIKLLRPTLGNQKVYAINKSDGFFTANHPFLTTQGWKSLDPETTKSEIPDLDVTLLQVGDILITENKTLIVKSIEASASPANTQLYNFELDGDHTYYANGYAVHNKYYPGDEGGLGQVCTLHKNCKPTAGGYYAYCEQGDFDAYPEDRFCIQTPSYLDPNVYSQEYINMPIYLRHPNNVWVAQGAPVPVGVQCGPVNATCGATEQTCDVGTVANYNYTTHTRQCNGSNGGSTASCSTVISGTCGSANGGTFTSVPTSNLCSAGSTSSVSGTGPWTWSCNGLNGGSNASCSATKSLVPVNAVCGTSHNQPTSAFPSAGLCTVGTPVIGVMTPDGSNNYTWSCQGINGGSTSSCLAPYVAAACVPYSSSIISAGSTRITPTSTDLAVFLNNNEYRNNTILDKVRYVNSSGYTFTGLVSPTQYLKVTITDLTNAGQFVQYRPTPSSINDNGGRGGENGRIVPEQPTVTPFFGCEAPQWGANDPLLWSYNLPLQNVGMMVDSADRARGTILPLSDPLHYISAFVAWNKPGKGFKVKCEVCPMTIPVTTRDEACKNLPEYAIPNTVSVITQTASGSVWTPSDIFAYNTVASTSECRFICEDNYTWDGSACIADTKTAFCLGTIPANALQNGPSSYIQTRNGSDRTPSGFTWNHNTSPNTCNFICKGGYNRNGNACVQNIAYAWEIGTRSVCSNNLQTRTVVCKNSYGNTVADNLCPAPKPATSQAASCPPVGACGGYGHVYVKEINRVNTKDINYPGDSACNIGVPQREKEDTCTYGFYSDTAGTLPINVSNLNVSISSVATYGNSTYINTISGLTFTQVCKTEESLDFPPAACAKYQENDISVVDNSCVTVIAGGGPSQPVCGATEGSCLVGTVDGRDSSFPPNQPWYCVQGANVAECAMPAQCGTRYGSYMFPTGTSAMPTDSPILCKYGSANPVPTLYGGNQVTSFTAWTCNGLDANSSVACTGSIGCQYILNGSPQTCG